CDCRALWLPPPEANHCRTRPQNAPRRRASTGHDSCRRPVKIIVGRQPFLSVETAQGSNDDRTHLLRSQGLRAVASYDGRQRRQGLGAFVSDDAKTEVELEGPTRRLLALAAR